MFGNGGVRVCFLFYDIYVFVCFFHHILFSSEFLDGAYVFLKFAYSKAVCFDFFFDCVASDFEFVELFPEFVVIDDVMTGIREYQNDENRYSNEIFVLYDFEELGLCEFGKGHGLYYLLVV